MFLFGQNVRGQSDIPDSPDVLCIESKNTSSIDDIYKLKGSGYWEAFNDEDYRLTLSTVNSADAWVIQHISVINSTTTITTTLFYCSDMPSDYDPEDDEQGDPQDCGEWTNRYLKVESITMTEDTENCAAFDTSLSWLDGVFLGYACLVVMILLFLMCPFSPFHKYCQRSRYEAAELEIYQKILQMRVMLY